MTQMMQNQREGQLKLISNVRQRQSLNSLWENDQWDVISYVETHFSDANSLSLSLFQMGPCIEDEHNFSFSN
jgi:hypothetical protein